MNETVSEGTTVVDKILIKADFLSKGVWKCLFPAEIKAVLAVYFQTVFVIIFIMC